MQSIRKYLLVDEIIDLLENERGLFFDNKISKDKFKLYLTQYNYIFFVKSLKHKLMFDEKGLLSQITGKLITNNLISNNQIYIF